MVKVVTLFLIVISALAAFGKFKPLEALKRKFKRPRAVNKYCPECGAPRAGKSNCPCGYKDN